MSQNKTRANDDSVRKFLNHIDHGDKRKDCEEILRMMQELTGCKPRMWGSSIVGFGSYHYKYESGREGDFMLVGFSPRKSSITIYIMPGFSKYESELKLLGKHKTGKSCLYINRLDQVDRQVLKKIISDSVRIMREKYPTTS